MKPTTDGRWAHLACAMWIPGLCNMCLLRSQFSLKICCSLKRKRQKHCIHFYHVFSALETCLSDVKKMEPIDGISRINKASLLLSVIFIVVVVVCILY